jgi:hypothetical protein
MKLLFEAAVPGWWEAPFGVLAKRWNDKNTSADAYNACYFIELYRVIDKLRTQLSARSRPIGMEKLRQVLKSKNNEQFEETFAELQVADLLLEKLPNLEMEPLRGGNAAKPDSSPDFSSRLSSGETFIEVTTFKFAILDEWNRAVEKLCDILFRELRARNLNQAVQLELPLSVVRTPLTTAQINELVEMMAGTADGEAAIICDEGKGRIRWHTPPVHYENDQDGKRWAVYPTLGIRVGGSNPSLNRSRSSAVIWPDDLADLIYKSLTNLVKRKRSQFPENAPYLLVVRLGHHLLPANLTADVITKRLWPNPLYAWLSAIGVFSPRTQFTKGGLPPTISVIQNANAEHSMSAEFVDLLSGRRLLMRKMIRQDELLSLQIGRSRAG